MALKYGVKSILPFFVRVNGGFFSANEGIVRL